MLYKLLIMVMTALFINRDYHLPLENILKVSTYGKIPVYEPSGLSQSFEVGGFIKRRRACASTTS